MLHGLASVLAAVLSAALWLIARLPLRLRNLLGRIVGSGYALLARDTRAVVIANLEHTRSRLKQLGVEVGDADQFARRNLRESGLLLGEVAVCWRGPQDAWRGLIDRVEGDEALAVLRAAGDGGSSGRAGVLLLSPHLGNWELLNMYLGAEFGITVLYDPPKIAALDPLIRRAREGTASTVLPIGPAGLRGMVQRLRQGGVVGLLPDQVPAPEAGVYAEFLGKQALTINLVHRLARRHEPRVFLVCAIRNASGRFDIRFDELTESACGDSAEQAAQVMNAAIERRIASAPEQYQWSYKRFKRPADGKPNIYRQAAMDQNAAIDRHAMGPKDDSD